MLCQKNYGHTFTTDRLRICFHFSSKNPIIFIVTHFKSTRVEIAVEDWEEDCRSEGSCFYFLLPGDFDVLSRLNDINQVDKFLLTYI